MANIKAIALFDSEWEALQGLPPFQFKLYMVLRWFMDRATGRVGIKRGISLKSLAEEMYVEPVRGRHSSDSGEPTRKAIRSALDGLVNARLIEPCGNGDVLVFLMPVARRALSRPKDEGHMRGTEEGHDEGHGKSRASKGFRPNEGGYEGHTQTADEGHTSRVKVNPPTVEASAAALPPSYGANLSTGDLLQLPLRPVDVCEWIRRSELQRGFRVRMLASDRHVASWIAMGLKPEELVEAYRAAVRDRVDKKNPSPLNLPFIDIFVQRVRESSRSAGGRNVVFLRPDLWHTTWDGLGSKAQELGIPKWDRSEGFVEFQQRVMAASRQAEEAKAGGDQCRI